MVIQIDDDEECLGFKVVGKNLIIRLGIKHFSSKITKQNKSRRPRSSESTRKKPKGERRRTHGCSPFGAHTNLTRAVSGCRAEIVTPRAVESTIFPDRISE